MSSRAANRSGRRAPGSEEEYLAVERTGIQGVDSPVPALAPVDSLASMGVAEIFADLPPVPWLVRGLGIAPGAPVLIAGYGYSRKTLAVQGLGLAVASGRPAWEFFDVRIGRVLHVDHEQGNRLSRERYQRLALGMCIGPADLGDRLRLAIMPSLYLDADDVELAYSRKVEGFDLVIIDSFRAAAPSTEENSSDVRRPLDMLTRISERTGSTFVVIHHARKPQKDAAGGARASVRGSGAIYDACDSVFVFSAEKGQATTVKHEKARTAGVTVEDFQLETMDVAAHGDPRAGLRIITKGASVASNASKASADHEAIKVDVLDLLRRETNHTDMDLIAVRVGRNAAKVRTAIKDLVRTGAVQKLDDVYRATTVGKFEAKA